MWATSIGSTFAQMPVPGVRKSGIPDGTEMPAPVSASTFPAEPISSARREGPGRERGLLGLDPLVEVTLVRHALDLLERERRLPGQLARPRKRRVEQLVVGH